MPVKETVNAISNDSSFKKKNIAKNNEKKITKNVIDIPKISLNNLSSSLYCIVSL